MLKSFIKTPNRETTGAPLFDGGGFVCCRLPIRDCSLTHADRWRPVFIVFPYDREMGT